MREQRLFKILISPYFSEKTTAENNKNQYAFKVVRDASKAEIKEVVEKLFKVKVVSVQVLNCKPRKVRFGRIQGKQQAWKKAYVRTAMGSEIDFTGSQF